MRDYYFMLDGERSTSYGIRLQRPLVFSKPKRKYRSSSIYGKNGDLLQDDGTFESVTCTAHCFVLEIGASEQQAGEAASWMLGRGGERRLETPEDPDVFRKVHVLSGYDTDIYDNKVGTFDVDFVSGPERWLKLGERSITAKNGIHLHNAWMPSNPLISVSGTGSGELAVNGITVYLLDIKNAVMLDSDLKDAYSGAENRNGDVYTPNGYPVLKRGDNVITWSGGVSGVTILPRWWSL